MLPAANARILNSERLNIGSSTLVSMMQNATSRAAPPSSSSSTHGPVQPMDAPLWGRRP